MKKQLLALAIVSSFFVASGASALTKDEYNVAKEKIEADYKVAKAQCDTMKDNAKDVCSKEASGTQKVAKADLENQYKPTASHARKVAEECEPLDEVLDVATDVSRFAEFCGICFNKGHADQFSNFSNEVGFANATWTKQQNILLGVLFPR